ncbi:hypothetical protein [Mycobacterium kansasii]|uniref:hypothetical protein n=1 Tax=Mycobacterium kansasii TaxID=1768 RepID=UPI000CDDA63E|nr:hypothetical protein [Mycobacterium kansasii]POY15215.1 hypothetical protein C3472_19860 [Mycobacterium kansasii]POY15218.1 hypothetical protein C3472_19875 [Mycobacterium kansasii]
MDTVDAVARAIFTADGAGEPAYRRDFTKLHESDQDDYRRMARAAIDALGLTTEERRLHNGQQVCSRLVSGWVRKDNTNE